MPSERRYGDDEVREIFRLATREAAAEAPRVSQEAGPTLGDLQEIGSEIGLEPTAVARAAAALDARRLSLPRRKSLGMPVQVGRIVPLPRSLTEREWEQLVAELRATFGARGRVRAQGGLREWVNGNLHACIEPAGSGHRLRLGTTRGDAPAVNALGFTGVATATVAYAALLASGGQPEAVFLPWMAGAAGIGAFVANWLRLPRWAGRREAQMEHIAARIGSIMRADPVDETSAPSPHLASPRG